MTAEAVPRVLFVSTAPQLMTEGFKEVEVSILRTSLDQNERRRAESSG